MAVTGFVHHEAAAGQRAVTVRNPAAVNLRQCRRGLDDRRAVFRERVEQAADKHVAEDAAERMEMDMPHKTSQSGSRTLNLPVASQGQCHQPASTSVGQYIPR